MLAAKIQQVENITFLTGQDFHHDWKISFINIKADAVLLFMCQRQRCLGPHPEPAFEYIPRGKQRLAYA